MNIQSREHAQKLGECVSKLCKEIFRDYNARENFSFNIEAHGGEGEGDFPYHTVSFSWCAVDVGFPVLMESITGDKTLPGYHTWITSWQPSASRWEPDDYDLETLSETLWFDRAVAAVVQEFFSWRLRMVQEAEVPDELTMLEESAK